MQKIKIFFRVLFKSIVYSLFTVVNCCCNVECLEFIKEILPTSHLLRKQIKLIRFKKFIQFHAIFDIVIQIFIVFIVIFSPLSLVRVVARTC